MSETKKEEKSPSVSVFNSLPFAILFIVLIVLKYIGIENLSWWEVFLVPIGASVFWSVFSTIFSVLYMLGWAIFQAIIGKNRYF